MKTSTTRVLAAALVAIISGCSDGESDPKSPIDAANEAKDAPSNDSDGEEPDAGSSELDASDAGDPDASD